MAHACNPSHSGGRDQGDYGSRPTGASSPAPILKISNIKKGWRSGPFLGSMKL
jgi:hypothetical protein